MTFSLNAPIQEKPLPLLRGDIKIYPGPADPDGTPTYNCLDPIKGQYYKISWHELTILQHLKPGMTLTQLTNELNQKSTLKVTTEEVQSFFEDAAKNSLLAIPRASEEFSKEAKQKKMHPVMWTLYHYLYIRVPILNPDVFLSKTLQYVRPFVSSPALLLYFILTVIGLFRLIDRFSEFLTTFPYFFNFNGLIIYGLAISCVKIIHEFSHAYVAKYYGLHIPTMGIAFIVLWPVLYTDVTDGWKLNKRSQRLAISFAGVAAEVILAGLATLGWTLSSPGLLQSVFFVIASATWISTLAVNLNPAMRFDGYYLMSDISGIDNLQARAFAYTRWQLRKWLLGLNIPPPEEGVSVHRRGFMLIYSIYTWIYRLILYTVIAIFVYYEFTKALGILLFGVEIAFFLLPPFVSEAKQLIRLAPFLTWNKRSAITTLILSVIFFWFVIPLPHRERFTAITVASENQIVYVPLEGKIESIHFKLGDKVQPDQVLLNLTSSPLQIEINSIKADISIIKSQLHILSIKEKDRAFLPEKNAELASAESKLRALIQKQKQLTLKSNASGVVYEWDDTLRPGEYISKNQVIAKIAALQDIQVLCFVPEKHVHFIKEGYPVTFRLDGSLECFKGKVIELSPVRQNILNYPPLASTNKGELPVNQDKEGKLLLVESYFAVRILLEDHPSLKLGQRGHVAIRGPWRSSFMEFMRYVQSIYLRESGL
ncbi:MAG: efflux RND transporter periplasmic adaptor subunit [Parachlamydiaceae bacterium]|nr:efflux RND transporter periplasmic adaptor subunit [Parachlamydiaceae bacterium]